ncbi:hypothetical protein [Nonomuraea sp. NPDC049480]|uniref:hypothetical protein n=1 Tax=Nonomuraea sp. NPDC049480 TaxID=3364353 RepID=UPI00378F1AC5
MTAQIPDTVAIDGTEHAIVAIDGGPLFDPARHGIKVAMLHTGCWRGHICAYTVGDSRLHLHALTLGPQTTVHGHPVSARPRFLGAGFADDGYGEYTAAPLRLEIPFSGRLLAARDFISGLYMHMGFAPGWKYEHVIELVLDGGHVTERRDRSREIVEIRRSIVGGEIPDPDGRRGAPGWVKQTFDLAYDRTFPRR